MPKAGGYQAVVIGASAGGVRALTRILGGLRPDFPLPLVVVQHISADGADSLPHHLASVSPLPVREAEEKQAIEPGTVYLAPPDYHLLIEKDRTFSLSQEERVNFSRPSIDVLFETAAAAYGPRLIGVVLTGANRDGSAGLKQVREHGGLAIVQDPGEAESDVMPLAALAVAGADHVAAAAGIAALLGSLAGGAA